MNIRKFYTGRVVGFAVVLVVVLAGAYMIKDREAPIPKAPEEEKTAIIPITIATENIQEENFTGTAARISGSSILAEKAEAYIEETVSEFRTQANTDVPDMRKEFGEDSPPASYTIDIGATDVKGDMTESIVISVYTYTGGAHGNSSYKVLTASRSSGEAPERMLSLADVIKPDKNDAFMAYLKRELKNWRPGDDGSVIFPQEVEGLTFESLENWSMDKKNLTIYFSQYEIGPGVLGPVAFPISLEKIREYLNPSFLSGNL